MPYWHAFVFYSIQQHYNTIAVPKIIFYE